MPLSNEQFTIYVNRSAEDDGSRLADILHDFGCCDPADMRIDHIRTEVDFYKNNEEGKTIMDLMSNSFYAAGVETGETIGQRKGEAIGMLKGKVQTKTKYIIKGFETVSEAAADIGITEEEFLKIASENGYPLS